jgi:hypothetical protein
MPACHTRHTDRELHGSIGRPRWREHGTSAPVFGSPVSPPPGGGPLTASLPPQSAPNPSLVSFGLEGVGLGPGGRRHVDAVGQDETASVHLVAYSVFFHAP